MYRALLNLFFPATCLGCELVLLDQEKRLCLDCQLELPYCNFHLLQDNPLEKTFWGRVKIERAFAYLLYKKAGAVKQIIQAIKYRGNQQLAIDLGEQFGLLLAKQLKEMHVTAIVAVPLHPKKFKKRGYNQSELLAQGIAQATQIQNASKWVRRIINTSTQTAKSRIERWENVASIYEIDSQLFELPKPLHLLLIDDVVTTGATIESLALSLYQVGSCKISVAALAFAP